MKANIGFLQFVGYVFTSVFGTLLHFLFDWTGKSIITAPFSAVNESIWEHMKLLFFPMLIFALIESKILNKTYKNFWCVKLIGILVGIIIIPVLYYTYTGILGAFVDWFNILIFFIAGAITYIIETKFYKKMKACPISEKISFLALLVIAAVFVVFTFFPIEIPLFRDPLDKTYGFKKQ